MIYPIHRLRRILQFITQHPLAGRHKWRFIFRFFSWQISQFIHPHETEKRFTSKTKLVLKKGLIGSTGNLYTGLHDFPEMGFLLHFLRAGDQFADIGANNGSYTVLASGHVGAKTVCFEPIDSTRDWLVKNIQANKAEELVQVYPFALGDVKKKVRFSDALDAENHVLIEAETHAGIFLEVEVFDDLCFPQQVPVLVKLDVEGYEAAVLSGMKKTLNDERLKAIIIELNGSGYRYGFDEKQIHADLLSYGFLPYTYNPFKRELILWESFGPNNTIYCRDLSFINERLQHAEAVLVAGDRF